MCAMKVTGEHLFLERFIIGRPCVLVTKGLSVSIDVGTRKMVNYA